MSERRRRGRRSPTRRSRAAPPTSCPCPIRAGGREGRGARARSRQEGRAAWILQQREPRPAATPTLHPPAPSSVTLWSWRTSAGSTTVGDAASWRLLGLFWLHDRQRPRCSSTWWWQRALQGEILPQNSSFHHFATMTLNLVHLVT